MKKILIITCLALLTLVGILIPKFLPKESNHEYKKEEKSWGLDVFYIQY